MHFDGEHVPIRISDKEQVLAIGVYSVTRMLGRGAIGIVSWPVEWRSCSAARMPATVVIAVTWSPKPGREGNGSWSVGIMARATPLRAQKAVMSNPPSFA
jgi:hypothetical protein